ncbi:MAG: hypothetical protein FWF42_03345 [Streptococcaceae bacterium]|nr:hypothetical protein [Streptococcaceae bacterium]MCL2681139.1 hypothetical protein [Streptococcaceae bacterium]MCL2858705.1 hypothetical protein [Streptococcaceae bacterium]
MERRTPIQIKEDQISALQSFERKFKTLEAGLQNRERKRDSLFEELYHTTKDSKTKSFAQEAHIRDVKRKQKRDRELRQADTGKEAITKKRQSLSKERDELERERRRKR